MNTHELLGINFYKGTYGEFLDKVKGKIENKNTALVVTPNPEMLYDASYDSELLNILKSADFALPDGAGIFVAYQACESTLPKFLKYMMLPFWCFQAVLHSHNFAGKYGERITGSRLTKDLMSLANERGIPITIIDPEVHGNTPGDMAKMKSQKNMKTILEEKYSGLKCSVIIGDSCEGIITELTELTELTKSNGINGNKAITFATHGGGKQEKLLSELMKKFPNAGIAIGVGGSIDLITGFRSPAPELFQKLGLEWLYRLWKNPEKHAKRMKKVIGFLLSCFER